MNKLPDHEFSAKKAEIVDFLLDVPQNGLLQNVQTIESSVQGLSPLPSSTSVSFLGIQNGVNVDDSQVSSSVLSSTRKRMFSDVALNDTEQDLLRETKIYRKLNESVHLEAGLPFCTVNFDSVSSTSIVPRSDVPVSAEGLHLAPAVSPDGLFQDGSSLQRSNHSVPEDDNSLSHKSMCVLDRSSSLSSSSLSLEDNIDNSFGMTSIPEGNVEALTDVKNVDLLSSTMDDGRTGKPRHLLPPCRICGDQASGFHYGANTCEACKGFFRRSLKKNTTEYKCSGNNNCTIQKGRRNNCTLCRYKKCIEIGMSKEAIKTGRYTHEKRTQYTVEVKLLQGDQLHMTVNTEPSKAQLQPASVSQRSLDLLQHIYTAHKNVFVLWHQMLDADLYKETNKQYFEKYQQKMALERESAKAQKNSFKSDADSGYNDENFEVEEAPLNDTRPKMQRDLLRSLVMTHIETAIYAFVKYAKALPGFTALSLNDQASLVKNAQFDLWMLGAHKFVDPVHDVASGPTGKTLHRQELADLIDADFVNRLFSFSEFLQRMDISREEVALLQAISLTFSDRGHLEQRDEVEKIQMRLVTCLQEVTASPRKFIKLMDALVRLRDLTELNKKISGDIFLEWPDTKESPLLLEVLTV